MLISENIADAVKAAPVAGYFTGWAAGIQWSSLASIAALIYSSLLIGEKLWKWYQAWKTKRETVA